MFVSLNVYVLLAVPTLSDILSILTALPRCSKITPSHHQQRTNYFSLLLWFVPRCCDCHCFLVLSFPSCDETSKLHMTATAWLPEVLKQILASYLAHPGLPPLPSNPSSHLIYLVVFMLFAWVAQVLMFFKRSLRYSNLDIVRANWHVCSRTLLKIANRGRSWPLEFV